MRLLVTGATGFLGRAVVAAAGEHQVVRLTRAMQASAPDEWAMGPAPWTSAALREALSCVQPDIIMHCAGSTHSPDPRSCFEANTVLAAELLRAVEAMPTRVMLIGSAAEYGIVPPGEQPVRETRHCAPTTEYAVAKHAQTLLGLAAARGGLPVLTARLFNPVGLGMPPGLALPSFARQLAGSQAVIRVGNLSPQRDFLDVAEVARLLLGLAVLPDWPWSVVNVCSGRAYALGHLLDRMISHAGRPIRVETDPALVRPNEMPVLAGSIERLSSVDLAPGAPDFDDLLPRLLVEAQATHRASCV